MYRQLILALAVVALIGGAALGSRSVSAMPAANAFPNAATIETVNPNSARIEQAGYGYRPYRRYRRPYYRRYYRPYFRRYYRPFVPFYRPYYRRPYYYGRRYRRPYYRYY